MTIKTLCLEEITASTLRFPSVSKRSYHLPIPFSILTTTQGRGSGILETASQELMSIPQSSANEVPLLNGRHLIKDLGIRLACCVGRRQFTRLHELDNVTRSTLRLCAYDTMLENVSLGPLKIHYERIHSPQ